MTWKFLNTGFNSGSFNMEFDEKLAHKFNNISDVPILRIYGWSPYTISLGFNQNILDFDSSKISQAGIDIVKRPTGGRAILHAHELTYSIVIPIGEQSPRSIYRFINEGLMCGISLMGIQVNLSENSADFRKLYQESTSIPCFSSSAKNEIQFEGRKLVGSAQRRYGKIILQHGSFLLGPQHREITRYLAPHIDSMKTIEDDLNTKTIDAETILGRKISFENAAECIKQGFEKEHDIVFEDLAANDIVRPTNLVTL